MIRMEETSEQELVGDIIRMTNVTFLYAGGNFKKTHTSGTASFPYSLLTKQFNTAVDRSMYI